jgi:Lrp/AsnC family transcriptional regulator, leucine-responsive regulatory protein
MDSTDVLLLDRLQRDGRRSIASLARELGMAPSSVKERMAKLEETGVITGYTAVVDPARIGWGVQAFLLARVEHGEPEFEEKMKDLPQVRACHMTSGRFDYILQVRARDIAELGRFIRESLEIEPGIPRVESVIVFQNVKEELGWAPARPAEPLGGAAL